MGNSKNTVIGFLLIFAILIGYYFLTAPSKEELAEQLEAIALWMTQYRQRREMYLQVSQRVRQGADLVVNGLDPVEWITAQILEEVKRKMK